jgi:hypothetical protein
MESFRTSASGLLLMVFSGQQIAWGILKAHRLVDSHEFQNKMERFWIVSVWYFGAIFGCRAAFFMKLSKFKLEVRNCMIILKVIDNFLHQLLSSFIAAAGSAILISFH